VFFGEGGTTAVTCGREARGLQSVAHAESITELKNRQKSLTDGGGAKGKPAAGCLGALKEALLGLWLSAKEGGEARVVEVLLLSAMEAFSCMDSLLMFFNGEGGIRRWMFDVGSESLDHAAAGGKVGAGGGGGVGQRQACLFERK